MWSKTYLLDWRDFFRHTPSLNVKLIRYECDTRTKEYFFAKGQTLQKISRAIEVEDSIASTCMDIYPKLLEAP